MTPSERGELHNRRIDGPNEAGQNCPTRMQGYWIETAVTLGIVCALGGLTVIGSRKLGAYGTKGPISLLGHLPLGARRFVYLIQVGEQVFVVGACERGFTKLGELGSGSAAMALGRNSFEETTSTVDVAQSQLKTK